MKGCWAQAAAHPMRSRASKASLRVATGGAVTPAMGAEAVGAGDDGAGEVVLAGFAEAVLAVRHRAHFAGEAELAKDDQVLRQGAVAEAAQGGEDEREVGAGFADAHAAADVGEREALRVQAHGHALRVAALDAVHQGLYLHQQRARASPVTVTTLPGAGTWPAAPARRRARALGGCSRQAVRDLVRFAVRLPTKGACTTLLFEQPYTKRHACPPTYVWTSARPIARPRRVQQASHLCLWQSAAPYVKVGVTLT